MHLMDDQKKSQLIEPKWDPVNFFPALGNEYVAEPESR